MSDRNATDLRILQNVLAVLTQAGARDGEFEVSTSIGGRHEIRMTSMPISMHPREVLHGTYLRTAAYHPTHLRVEGPTAQHRSERCMSIGYSLSGETIPAETARRIIEKVRLKAEEVAATRKAAESQNAYRQRCRALTHDAVAKLVAAGYRADETRRDCVVVAGRILEVAALDTNHVLPIQTVQLRVRAGTATLCGQQSLVDVDRLPLENVVDYVGMVERFLDGILADRFVTDPDARKEIA